MTRRVTEHKQGGLSELPAAVIRSNDTTQEHFKQWRIPANLMFIGSPGDHFLYGLAELVGVRLII